MESAGGNKAWPGLGWLRRGKSVIAPIALGSGLVLVMVVTAITWWTWKNQQHVDETDRIQQLNTWVALTAQSAEAMLSANELTAVRRLLIEAARVHDMFVCRIVLPDGRILADCDPMQITAHRLPPTWPGSVTTEPSSSNDGTVATLHYPLTIAGRGLASLEVQALIRRPAHTSMQTFMEAGAIAIVGLAVLLLLYRSMRTRVEVLSVIQQALHAMNYGETTHEVLVVDETLGQEAQVWNSLLHERDALNKKLLSKHLDQTLAAKREHGSDLISACDTMRQGVMVIDAQLKVTYANGAAAAFLRTKREDITDRHVTEIIDNSDILALVQGALAHEAMGKNSIETEQSDDQGNGLLRFTVRPTRNDDATGKAIVIIEDITQQRIAEHARNTFVAHATHELRMPLTNIRLYVETALSEGEDDPKLRGECLNVINQESMRLEHLVGDMLSVAQIEAGSLNIERDDVRLEPLFTELEADFKARAKEKQITLTFNMPPKVPVIQGDRVKIMLALQNLVGNAIKYTPDGGQVFVDVDVNATHVTVDIKDTGIGMTEKDTQQIFERFYRANDPRVAKLPGSGLGLSLAREVIRLHGGDIVAQSTMDEGSVFTLTLPVTSDAA